MSVDFTDFRLPFPFLVQIASDSCVLELCHGQRGDVDLAPPEETMDRGLRGISCVTRGIRTDFVPNHACAACLPCQLVCKPRPIRERGMKG
jgi:hypothetical protein